MTINQFSPWILPSMCICALVSYPQIYVKALARTNKNSEEYVPPEKRVWKVFTIGDICAWIYAIIWMPVFLFVGINIAGPSISENLSDIYAEDYKMPIHVFISIFILLILGPVGSDAVRILVNKKF